MLQSDKVTLWRLCVPHPVRNRLKVIFEAQNLRNRGLKITFRAHSANSCILCKTKEETEAADFRFVFLSFVGGG